MVEKINMHLPQTSKILCLVAQVRENEQQSLSIVVQFALLIDDAPSLEW